MDDQLREHISRLREEFSKGRLDESEVEKDPADQFKKWMQDAVEARIIELQAMNLSTVAADGKPSSRVVYLREFGENQYTFYTNYHSRKSTELEKNPCAAISFYWPHLERQVRIEGTVQRSPASVSDAYFANRPYESKIGAWASDQSEPLSSRTSLEKKIAELRAKMPADKIQRPPHWGGLTLTANYYEFWQGRESRLHDRLCYTRRADQWTLSRIAP